MGAGVIPFTRYEKQIYFLLQRVFAGRKTGYLIDFGGGVGEGESYHEAAIREFIEETETLYFTDNLSTARRTIDSVNAQIPIVTSLFTETLTNHPDWCCTRISIHPNKPKDWKTFFIEFPYKDIEPLNRAWKTDNGRQFKKRRELVWLTADELLTYYQDTPEKLWKRVRQLARASDVIHSIQQYHAPTSVTF